MRFELAKIDSNVEQYTEEKIDVKALADELNELKKKVEIRYILKVFVVAWLLQNRIIMIGSINFHGTHVM